MNNFINHPIFTKIQPLLASGVGLTQPGKLLICIPELTVEVIDDEFGEDEEEELVVLVEVLQMLLELVGPHLIVQPTRQLD